MKKRLLIIGATGNTGYSILKNLANDDKFHINVVIHSNSKLKLVTPYADKVWCFDYKDETKLAIAINHIDILYMVLPRNDSELIYAACILKYAQKYSVKHIIYLSSLFSEDNTSSFAQTKRAIENTIKETGLIYTILKPNFFMNKIFHLPTKLIGANMSLICSVGESSLVSFVDVYDIAQIAILAMSDSKLHNRSIMLTGSSAVSINEITTWLTHKLGQNIYYINESESNYSKLLKDKNYSSMQIKKQLATFRLWRNGELSFISNDFYYYMGRYQRSYKQFIQHEIKMIREWAMQNRRDGS